MTDTPNPGSPAATRKGCTCPVLDNAHGKGIPNQDGTRSHYVDSGCPLHGRNDDGEG